MVNVSLMERVRRIESLDLGPIKFKLVYGEHEPMSRDTVDILEQRYKRFLVLSLKYRQDKIVPDKEIDNFWHAHILDFGHFLHHFPYFGMRGVEDAQHLQDAFLKTKRLYETEFGEPYRTEGADCQVSSCDAEQCMPNIGAEFTRPTLIAA